MLDILLIHQDHCNYHGKKSFHPTIDVIVSVVNNNNNNNNNNNKSAIIIYLLIYKRYLQKYILLKRRTQIKATILHH